MDVLVVAGSDALDGGDQVAAAHLPDLVAKLAVASVDVRVAILSTDLGVPGDNTLGGNCPRPLGDEGMTLRPSDTGAGFIEGFSGDYADVANRVIDGVESRIEFGVRDRCPVPRIFDVVLAALSPAEPPWPLAVTEGNGEDGLGGFVRNGAYLVVVVVSAQDDCSHSEHALFAVDGPYESVPLAARCALHPEVLLSVDVAAERLRRIRHPDTWGWVFVTGLPSRLESLPEDVLSEPELQIVLDSTETSIVPVCSGDECRWSVDDSRREPEACGVTGRDAFPFEPPRRLASLAARLRDAGVTVSMVPGCSDSEPEDLLGSIAGPLLESLPE